MAATQFTNADHQHAAGAAVSDVKAMEARGRTAEALERYGEIVAAHQRRALRIAYRSARPT